MRDRFRTEILWLALAGSHFHYCSYISNAKLRFNPTPKHRFSGTGVSFETMEKFSSVETNLTFNSIKSLITSMCLILTIILSCFCGILAVEGSLNFKYQAYETSRLCPDLQDSIIENDVNSQDKSSFQLVNFRYWDKSELPCLLKSSDWGPQKRTVLIAGIHADTKPWKFSSDAETCREHVKVRLPQYYHPAKSGDDFEMVCRVPKRPHSFVKLNVSDIGLRWCIEFALRDNLLLRRHKTPSLYNLGNRKLVINFSNVNLTYSNDSDLLVSEHQKDYWFQHDRILPSLTNFIKIIFIVRTAAGDCYVQVQQYLIKGQKELSCQYLHQVHPFRLCGVYGCDKIWDLLREHDLWETKIREIPKIIFRSSDTHPTRTRPKRREPYIGSKLKIVAFLVVVSLLIFGVCYVFGIRHRTSTIGNGDSQIRNCNGNSDIATVRPPPTTTVVMVVTNYEVIPLVQIGAEEEPPPSYNSLDTLPTYEEATTLGKNS